MKVKTVEVLVFVPEGMQILSSARPIYFLSLDLFAEKVDRHPYLLDYVACLELVADTEETRA
jgi:hypothetical protein